MEPLKLITDLYQPFQPSPTGLNPTIHYFEIKPDPMLQPYISCYWELRTVYRLHVPFKHLVITDGCMDIYFETSNPYKSFIMGMSEQYEEFTLGASFHYYGIRFFPAIFPQLYKVNAAELTNKQYELSQIAPQTSHFIQENFESSKSFEKASQLFNQHYLKLITDATIQIDARFYEALYEILNSNGKESLESIQTGLSHRQLQRLFNQYIGTTPKRFSKIIRFQKMIQEAENKVSPFPKNNFYNAGYYDQAHFIKEFKLHYGRTPKSVI